MLFQPVESTGACSAISAVPACFSKKLVAGAHPYYTRFKEGEILSQEIPGYNYALWLHYFTINAPASFTLQGSSPFVSLLCMFEGGISFCGCEEAATPLAKNEFRMLYGHSGALQAQIPAGKHVLCEVLYTAERLAPYAGLDEMLTQLVNLALADPPVVKAFRSSAMTHWVKDKVRSLFNSDYRNELEKTVCENNAVDELLNMYTRSCYASAAPARQAIASGKDLSTVRYFVVDNATKNFSLTELSQQFQIPVNVLKRDFKKHYGRPLHEYQLQERIRIAEKLVCRQNIPFADIALQCGFYDAAHFSRYFKRLTGKTPKEYRNSN